MRLAGWILVSLGVLGLAGTMLVAAVDIGVRDQYFADTGTLPWYMAISMWSSVTSILLCVLGAFLVHRGGQHNALS